MWHAASLPREATPRCIAVASGSARAVAFVCTAQLQALCIAKTMPSTLLRLQESSLLAASIDHREALHLLRKRLSPAVRSVCTDKATPALVLSELFKQKQTHNACKELSVGEGTATLRHVADDEFKCACMSLISPHAQFTSMPITTQYALLVLRLQQLRTVNIDYGAVCMHPTSCNCTVSHQGVESTLKQRSLILHQKSGFNCFMCLFYQQAHVSLRPITRPAGWTCR